MKVLCTAPILRFPKVVKRFHSLFDGTIQEYMPYNELCEVVGDYTGIVPNARVPIDAQVIGNAKLLRALYQPSMGYDHIDVDSLRERGINFGALSLDDGFRATLWSTAEHTLSLILALLKESVKSINNVKLNGAWDNRAFSIRDLRKCTVGIIGYGNIGRKVAHLCQAFGARIVANDPYIEIEKFSSEVEFLSLHDLLKASDVVTLHVPLDKSTKGLLSLDQLELLSPRSIVVNASRGGIVNEDDLMFALENKLIAGAALDVLQNESPEGVSHLKIVDFAKDYDNLVITPHVGGSSVEYMEEIFLHSLSRLSKMLAA